MGKSQPEKIFSISNNIPNGLKKQESSPESPPQVPPRMKKKGPALPEKPPHMRANYSVVQSSQFTREPLKPRIQNLDKNVGTHREVLVAASKAGREKPVEKRQREPAKLLAPTTGLSNKQDIAISSLHLDDSLHAKEFSIFSSRGPIRLEDCLPLTKKDISILPSKNPLWTLENNVPIKKLDKRPAVLRQAKPLQPVVLIPRNLLQWGSAPVSYALWTQRDPGRGGIKPIKQGQARQGKSEISGTSAVRMRSGSVTRSGSLTSQGSSSSESGGETFPKSVLKKQKRNTTSSSLSKGSNNRKVEQKKNVTFNAFATVQLMEE